MTAIRKNIFLSSIIASKLNEDTNQTFTISIVNQDGQRIGILSCVDAATVNDPSIISDITRWRNRYKKYFFTQFESTFDRTKKWLNNFVIPSQDRIFFLICLLDGTVVGNYGICNLTEKTGELDNLIRGRKGGDPQLIYFTKISFLNWIFLHLDYDRITLQVFSSNYIAIKLYLSVGFIVMKSIPLCRCTEEDGTVRYMKEMKYGDTANHSCLQMEITKESFYHLHAWIKNAPILCSK